MICVARPNLRCGFGHDSDQQVQPRPNERIVQRIRKFMHGAPSIGELRPELPRAWNFQLSKSNRCLIATDSRLVPLSVKGQGVLRLHATPLGIPLRVLGLCLRASLARLRRRIPTRPRTSTGRAHRAGSDSPQNQAKRSSGLNRRGHLESSAVASYRDALSNLVEKCFAFEIAAERGSSS